MTTRVDEFAIPWGGFSLNHRPIDHLTPTHTNQLTNQLTINQMYRPPTKRPPTSKKMEGQKIYEFIFDINYDFKT